MEWASLPIVVSSRSAHEPAQSWRPRLGSPATKLRPRTPASSFPRSTRKSHLVRVGGMAGNALEVRAELPPSVVAIQAKAGSISSGGAAATTSAEGDLATPAVTSPRTFANLTAMLGAQPQTTTPGKKIDATGAEHRPQRHLKRAGIRRRHYPDSIDLGNAENHARPINDRFEFP